VTYALARDAKENDTIVWLSTPDSDLIELARLAAVAERRTLRAALDHGRASDDYAVALAAEVVAEADLAYAQSLVDPTIESTLALDNILKIDSEYVIIRFVNKDTVEVGRAAFGSARASHARGTTVYLVVLRVEAVIDVEMIIEGAPISAGNKGDITLPFDGRITGVKLIADQAGDVVVDVLKSAFPAVPAVSITNGSKPTLVGAVTYSDVALAGWTTGFLKNDVLRVVVDSAAVVERVTVSLTCTTAV
jgi:hypothetical protein